MSTSTETLIDFLTGPPGMDLVFAFMADLGGDPEEYGLDHADLASVTDAQAGSALQISLERAVGAGLVDDPDVVDALRSGDADWDSVAASSLPTDEF
jgi:hypothetical protein